MTDIERILEGLNDEQRRAVETATGPVAIIAGAGSGKTRVVSHRTAYAVATGVVAQDQVLLVTFTEKAAGEMAARVRGLGLGRVMARTFHSAALAQLRYFWPSRHDGADLPEVLADKWRIVAPLARNLPGGYRFTPAKDLMDEIEWAKSRRITPATYLARATGRTPPTTPDLFVRLFRDYERAKQRRGLIDFDDILGLTVELLEDDEEAALAVRSRYSWFTVDEYQDTTPLQARLLELWLGDRRDICVVGDQDQTIYTFAGATPEHLMGFGRRYPDAVVLPLLTNYRSSPQVLALANHLLGSTGSAKRLVATQGEGPEPSVSVYGSAAEEEAAIVARVKALIGEGVAADQIAVLLRLNAQTVGFEEALAREGIPYQLRGKRFFERREVRAAVRALERVPDDVEGEELLSAVRAAWERQLGFDPDDEPEGREGRERHATLSTLLTIVSQLVLSPDGADRDDVVASLAERAQREQADEAGGVELLTLHRAKGLEWDAVLIPALEEGSLPVSQAGDDEDALAEERRLLYVGITRARRHLGLSWARQRLSPKGSAQNRKPSRFLSALGVSGPAVTPTLASRPGPRERQPAGAARARLSADDAVLFDALRAWRLETAREEKVSPFIVAYDTVIAEIAERRPQNESELLSVAGIGPGKVEKYGEDILAIVREGSD
ncbi:MAG: ATP-dependent DNA helicase UvrD2 [Candidatus Limnocylindrales bacterium]